MAAAAWMWHFVILQWHFGDASTQHRHFVACGRSLSFGRGPRVGVATR